MSTGPMQTILEQLTPAQWRVLLLLPALGNRCSTSAWQGEANHLRLGGGESRTVGPAAFALMRDKFEKDGLIRVADPSDRTVSWMLSGCTVLELLQFPQARSAARAIQDATVAKRPTNWSDGRGQLGIHTKFSMWLGCVEEKPDDVAFVLQAMRRGRYELVLGPETLIREFGTEPHAILLAALSEEEREGYIRYGLARALESLQPVTLDALQTGLASSKRETVMLAARLYALTGRMEQLEQDDNWKKRKSADHQAIRAIAAFFDERFEEARDLAQEAIASNRSRKYAQLSGLEGLVHALCCGALVHQTGSWQQLDVLTTNAVAAKVGHISAYALLSEFVKSPTGASPAILAELLACNGNWPDVLCALAVAVWTDVLADTGPVLAAFLGRTASTIVRAEAAGFVGLAITLKKLVDALQTGKRAARSLGAAYQVRESWELVLEGLVSLGQQHVARDVGTQSKVEHTFLHWILDLRFVAGAPNLSPIEPDDSKFSLQPRLCSSGSKGMGKQVGLARLWAGEVPEVDSADRLVVATMLVYPQSWNGRVQHDFPARALLALAGHPRVVTPAGQPLEIVRRKPTLEVKYVAEQGKTKPPHALVTIRPAELARAAIVVDQRTAGQVLVYERGDATQRLLSLFGSADLLVPEAGFAQLSHALATLNSDFFRREIDVELGEDKPAVGLGKEVQADGAPLARLHWNGEVLRVELRVAPLGLQGPHVLAGAGVRLLVAKVNEELLQTTRDLAGERLAVHSVAATCQSLASWLFDNDTATTDDLDLALTWLTELHDSMGHDRLVWPEKRRLVVRRPAGVSALRGTITQSTQWLSCGIGVQVDEDKVLDLQALLAARESNGKFVRLAENEFIGLTGQLRQRIDSLENLGSGNKRKKIELAPVLLPALVELFEGAGALTFDTTSRAQLDKIEASFEIRPRRPASFAGELREYQREGFVWLARLAQAGFGAVLADDMGLGKTVQTLALLCHRSKNGPALVVAPASVVHNWVQEIARFAPSLQAIALSSGDRHATLAALKPRDVVLCSYGVLSREQEALEKIRFATAVFDEAHALKNATTSRAKAAFALQVDFRICLSGTPVENHLVELWSVFQAAIPGLLDTQPNFERRFAKPIAEGDSDRARQLRGLIRPFLLRRTKAQVLDELPERTEITVRVAPTPEEVTFYEALRRRAVDQLAQASKLGKKGQLQILAEITKLRQAAVSPALVDAEHGPSGAKMEELCERLLALRDEGHRALVFTQFLGAMAMLRARLDTLGISYLSLDGSTPVAQRAQDIEAFQNGEAEVFIMSLKAGGVGINLTAADYVFHVDPWWNPATEDQATGRAHRMGQVRPVTVYRMISQGTIEEKIAALHQKKRELADDLLSGMETNKALDLEQLRALLEQ